MTKTNVQRDRLSIDVLPEEHRRIKAYAAFHGQTIGEYVLKPVRERLRLEEEEGQLQTMTMDIGPVLKELWDNEKDASYDEI